MKYMNICLSCDNNYAQYAGVVIASILLNSNNDYHLNFYILDGNIEQENKNKIDKLKEIKDFNLKFVPIDENLFDVYKKIGTHSYISLSTYYRLKLPSLLPDVDKVLYLDCDVIVNSDLSKLFENDISDYYAAGVKDIAVNSSGFVPKLEKGNLYEHDVDVNEDDKFISLYTCTKFFGNDLNSNLVVTGRLLRKGEKVKLSTVEKTEKYDEIVDIMKGGEVNE